MQTAGASLTREQDFLTVLQVTDSTMIPHLAEVVIYSKEAVKIACLCDIIAFRNLECKMLADKLITKISSSAK